MELISESLIEKADGLALWKLCSERFALTKKGKYEKEEIKSEFKLVKKEDN